MTLSVNDAGTWKGATPYCNDGGVWKLPLEVWVKDDTTWKLSWAAGGGSPPPTFDPVPGSYSPTADDTVLFTVGASAAVSWTWTVTGGAGVTANRAQGESATTIQFSLSTAGVDKVRGVFLTATSGGVTYNWTITMTVHYGGGGGDL